MADPAAAAPLPGMIDTLTALATRRDVRVAIVSGRALSDLRARCPVPGCWYVGGHGNEIGAGAAASDDLSSASVPAPAQAMRRRLAAIADQIRERLPQWPGTRLEAKPYSLAVHFRQAPRWEEPIREAFSAFAAAGGCRVLLGRQVIELLPDDALTKGHAVERLRHRLGCELAFYFGDDTTDEDVFRLRHPQIIGVKVENRESDAPTQASWRVGSPQEVLEALQAILELRQQVATAAPSEKLHKNYATPLP
ncbi:MAG: trehalose-phosphatase [Terriglobales bacterium]